MGVAPFEVGHDRPQGAVVGVPVAAGQGAQGVGRAREGLAARVHRRDRAGDVAVAAGDQRGDRARVGGHGRVARGGLVERRQDVGGLRTAVAGQQRGLDVADEPPEGRRPGRLPRLAVRSRGGAQGVGGGGVAREEPALPLGLLGEGPVERRLVRPALGQGVT